MLTALHYSDKTDLSFPNLYNQCDVLLCTGDLEQTDFIGLELQASKKPAFGVYGNHDSGSYLETLGIINLHHTVFEWSGLRWGGFQGCPRYKPGVFQFSEDEARYFYENFPHVDVLLLHAGPRNMLDDTSDEVHIGSEWIAKYVLEKKPRYVFCGHQYSHADLEIGETQLFRSYGARLVPIADDTATNHLF